jgi:hypothetical protein
MDAPRVTIDVAEDVLFADELFARAQAHRVEAEDKLVRWE